VNRRAFVSALVLGLLAAPRLAGTQPGGRIYRIGWLDYAAPESPELKAVREGLRELGYVEGQNIIVESRYAEGKNERLPALAEDLVRLTPDVIVTRAAPAARAAKGATSAIPIVMVTGVDPVASGLVASLARPGGNITGLTFLTEELSAKRLEVLREVLPRLQRVAVLDRTPNPRRYAGGRDAEETKRAAQSLGVQLQIIPTRATEDDLDEAFRAMTRHRAEAVMNLPDPIFFEQRRQIAALAARHRLPWMSEFRGNVEAGGLMSYGPDILAAFRRAAVFVDKILKGAKPADLPIEQATKFELVINLKTAKALGLTIPQSLLLRADELIQ
jgi:putative ABC transport system substrate-binding protein